MTLPPDVFTDIPWSFQVQVFLEDLLRPRRDLFVDPFLAEPWSCDPERCRPLLGRNLCCKVETRCRHFREDRCSIHEEKPFSCALFPLDLLRVGGIRIVTTVANPAFFDTGWSRYDADMLRCFENQDPAAKPMFQVMRATLRQVFTRAEVAVMEKSLGLHDAPLPLEPRLASGEIPRPS